MPKLPKHNVVRPRNSPPHTALRIKQKRDRAVILLFLKYEVVSITVIVLARALLLVQRHSGSEDAFEDRISAREDASCPLADHS